MHLSCWQKHFVSLLYVNSIRAAALWDGCVTVVLVSKTVMHPFLMLSPCCWRTRTVEVSFWLNAGSQVVWVGRRDQECRQGQQKNLRAKTHFEHSEAACAYLLTYSWVSLVPFPDSPVPLKHHFPLSARYFLSCVLGEVETGFGCPGVCFEESLWTADSLGNQRGQLTKGFQHLTGSSEVGRLHGPSADHIPPRKVSWLITSTLSCWEVTGSNALVCVHWLRRICCANECETPYWAKWLFPPRSPGRLEGPVGFICRVCLLLILAVHSRTPARRTWSKCICILQVLSVSQPFRAPDTSFQVSGYKGKWVFCQSALNLYVLPDTSSPAWFISY